MKKLIIQHLILILFIVVFSKSYAQKSGPHPYQVAWNSPFSSFQESYRDSLVKWQERVLLHIANPQVVNEDVFFKAYLSTGTHLRHSLSGVLNVELLNSDGALIKQQFHKVTNGIVEGVIVLPKKIEAGQYSIRCYTRWMENYGEGFYTQRQILVGDPIIKTTDIYNVSGGILVPEGGTLLNGYENRLVIKIPVVVGEQKEEFIGIVDEHGNIVAKIDSYSKTKATALFKPKKGSKYRVKLGNGVIYPLPDARDEGFLLQVNNIDPNYAKIRVTASPGVVGTGVKLVGTLDGIRYFENKLNFKSGNIIVIEIPKSDIPNGILTLDILDEAEKQLATRSIWIDGELLHIDVSPMTVTKGETTYKIKVTDKSNLPVKTQLAVSANQLESSPNIINGNYLKESLDFFAYPEIMLDNDIMKTRKNRFLKDLDLILSTINYDNSFLNIANADNSVKFPVQKALELKGYAYDLNNKLLRNTRIQIVAQSKENAYFKETTTDTNGLLELEGLELYGKATLILRTKGQDTKSKLVKLKPINPVEEAERDREVKFETYYQGEKKNERNRVYEPTSSQPIDTTGLIRLDEAVVSESKKPKGKPSVYGITPHPQRVRYQDPKKPKTIEQLLLGIPRVTLAGIGGQNPSVTIVGGTGPILFVIDGFPLAQSDSGTGLGSSGGNDLTGLLDRVNFIDVERIEVLIGAEAAIYGTRAAGGVILIYTRTGAELEFINRKDGELVIQGYEPSISFDAYRASLSKRAKQKSKILYWNPELETDENGEAIIKIATPHNYPLINFKVTTVTQDGKIGLSKTSF